MSFGKNLQYLRQLSANMTQETLAEKLNVSRQTISKWEMDAANPEMDKALEICKIFSCTLDNLFREEMDKRRDAYSNLRTETVEGFRYVEYTVISREPEADAIGRMYKCAEENGIADPKVIGWDFPKVSQEQGNTGQAAFPPTHRRCFGKMRNFRLRHSGRSRLRVGRLLP